MMIHAPRSRGRSLALSSVAVAIGAVVTTTGLALAATVSQVPVESPGDQAGLSDVAVVSASDGWAVGGNGDPLVERFDGSRWSIVTSADLADLGSSTDFAGLGG